MNDVIRARQDAIANARRNRNIIANHIAAAVVAGDLERATRLAPDYKSIADEAIRLWMEYGDELGLKGRLDDE